MNKILAILLLTVSMSHCVAARVRAASEFTTTFNSLYTISRSGETSVTHTITLKNNLAHIYATNYSVATSGDKITNITASDEHGPISTTSNTQNGVTTISLGIAVPSIGKDQLKTISLSYMTDDVVENIADTTTINIPRLARANEAESYTRIVRVEGVTDKEKLVYPEPNAVEPDGEYIKYTFIGHLGDSLTLLFGESVTYKLNLSYELKNNELKPGDSELALPSDTGYQQVMLKSITPPPKTIRVDDDGNWLARYNLKSQEKLMVEAELYVTVYPRPILFDPSKKDQIKTQKAKYFDTTSDLVVSLAERLRTTENIYHYLTDNFTYNYAGAISGSSRKGALQALSSPTNVLCTEFTDSFVSLSRTLGIPAREINGYGYTKNRALRPQSETTDILHAWPEYLNSQNQWISVDPTWGNTTGGVDYFNKLDFSHITFVRHGLEEDYPLPAGAYKTNPDSKYVHVEIVGGMPAKITDSLTKDNIIYNTGNVAIQNETVGYLPPYGSIEIVESKKTSFYDKIRSICAKLLSKFSQLLPAST